LLPRRRICLRTTAASILSMARRGCIGRRALDAASGRTFLYSCGVSARRWTGSKRACAEIAGNHAGDRIARCETATASSHLLDPDPIKLNRIRV
jgi:hypothetical protein